MVSLDPGQISPTTVVRNLVLLLAATLLVPGMLAVGGLLRGYVETVTRVDPARLAIGLVVALLMGAVLVGMELAGLEFGWDDDETGRDPTSEPTTKIVGLLLVAPLVVVFRDPLLLGTFALVGLWCFVGFQVAVVVARSGSDR